MVILPYVIIVVTVLGMGLICHLFRYTATEGEDE